jgi:hypothetical protein
MPNEKTVRSLQPMYLNEIRHNPGLGMQEKIMKVQSRLPLSLVVLLLSAVAT